MSTLDDLSLQFAIDLFNVRLNAEKRKDEEALHSLKVVFPELFTTKIEGFMEEYSQIMNDTYHTYETTQIKH